MQMCLTVVGALFKISRLFKYGNNNVIKCVVRKCKKWHWVVWCELPGNAINANFVWSLQNKPCAAVTRRENNDLNFESVVSKLLLHPFFRLLDEIDKVAQLEVAALT